MPMLIAALLAVPVLVIEESNVNPAAGVCLDQGSYSFALTAVQSEMLLSRNASTSLTLSARC